MFKKKDKIFLGLSYILVIFVIVPLIMATFIMFPSADDFSNTNAVLSLGGNIFTNTFEMSKTTYLTWQGTYFSVVLVNFLSNLIKGSIGGFRIICIGNISVFLSGIFYLVQQIFRGIVKEYKIYIINIVFGIAVFMLTFGRYVDEALYWFTGVCVYTIPLTCFVWGIALLIKYNFEPKRRLIVIACILLFCAAGGSLQITALTCGVLLGIVFITLKQKKWHNLIAFLISLGGAFINVLAPGYYLRHEELDDEYHIFDTIISSYKSVTRAVKMQFSSIVIVFCLIMLIMIGCYLGKKVIINIYMKHILGVAIYLAIGLVIVDFPVYLGYGGYFPSRCLFIENVAASMTLIILSIMIGIWLSKVLDSYKKKIFMVTMLIVYVVFFLQNYRWFGIANYPILNIYHNWSNGNIASYVEENEYIFEQLKEGKGKDIVIESQPDCMGIYPQIGISRDLNMWTNRAIAEFYSLDSIKEMN